MAKWGKKRGKKRIGEKNIKIKIKNDNQLASKLPILDGSKSGKKVESCCTVPPTATNSHLLSLRPSENTT